MGPTGPEFTGRKRKTLWNVTKVVLGKGGNTKGQKEHPRNIERKGSWGQGTQQSQIGGKKKAVGLVNVKVDLANCLPEPVGGGELLKYVGGNQ